MQTAPIPDDETERLQVLERYDLADERGQGTYDELARLASYVTGARVGIVSIIGEEDNRFKASRNVARQAIEREISFCGHLVTAPDELMVIEDAREDPRFAQNPLVVDDPGIRFYAGCPLVTPDEHVIGSLCAFDPKPGSLTSEQSELLAALGNQVMANLAARRRIRELDEQIERLNGG